MQKLNVKRGSVIFEFFSVRSTTQLFVIAVDIGTEVFIFGFVNAGEAVMHKTTMASSAEC